jgi:methyl-accepting chemotaxis protein
VKTWFNDLSLSAKLILSTAVVLVVGTLALIGYLSRATRQHAVEQCVANAKSTIEQFKILRTYYTSHVVGKVAGQAAVKVSDNHKAEANTIPLPATLIQDLSEELSKNKENPQLRLYSDYPFPQRRGRIRDEFSKEALEFLQTHPEETFIQVGPLDGRESVRVAIADKMTSQACVNCHNSHPQSPKKDWKLGDVRGVLEVSVPIEAQMARNAGLTRNVQFLTGAIGLVLLAAVALIARFVGRRLAQTVKVLEAVAEGNLTERAVVSSQDEIGRMTRALNQAMDGIAGAFQEVRVVANDLVVAAQQLAAATTEISGGAQEQAASLEETAASLEQISATVQQNADNAQQAHQLAGTARDVAGKGGTVVTSAVTAMSEINQASKKIADIITAIDEIAFQTNLLALNAAVEAARAGEQGRGFAVVAAEVRSLAQRSASAAKEIKGLIQDSVRKVEAGSELVNRSGQSLQDIITSVQRVVNIVAEIAAASKEQATGIEQVNKAVSQMDAVTQNNAAQTEELSSTAQALAQQAGHLQDLVARFYLHSDKAQAAESAAPISPSARAGLQATATRRPVGKVAEKIEACAPASDQGNSIGHERHLVGTTTKGQPDTGDSFQEF